MGSITDKMSIEYVRAYFEKAGLNLVVQNKGNIEIYSLLRITDGSDNNGGIKIATACNSDGVRGLAGVFKDLQKIVEENYHK